MAKLLQVSLLWRGYCVFSGVAAGRVVVIVATLSCSRDGKSGGALSDA